jgi:peptidoglycan/LPS O-acetylase OafA/YrhL
MFENWEVAPFKWNISPRAATWAALLWAFVAGMLTGLLLPGRLPLDALRIMCVAILLGGAALLIVRFARPGRKIRGDVQDASGPDPNSS